MKRCFPALSVWRVVIPRAFVVALVLFALQRCALGPTYAVEPPMLLIFDKPATLYAPNGVWIDVPAGTEIDACVSLSACPDVPGGCTLDYVLEPTAVRIPEPCIERPLFGDSFEGAP